MKHVSEAYVTIAKRDKNLKSLISINLHSSFLRSSSINLLPSSSFLLPSSLFLLSAFFFLLNQFLLNLNRLISSFLVGIAKSWNIENPVRRSPLVPNLVLHLHQAGRGHNSSADAVLYTKSMGKVCNFFKWYDEACSEREKKLINALLKKNDLLQNSNNKLVIGIVCLGLIVMFQLIVIVMLMFM